MIASLPMYDRAELRAHTDRFWQAIRDAAEDGPDTLTRDTDPWQDWLSPELFLSQTCGLPYRSHLHGKVRLVATPDYGLNGCPPGYYNSVIVVRSGDTAEHIRDLAGRRIAINDPVSQSGWAAPVQHLLAADVAPGETIFSGAHVASIQAVAEGQADFAGIDALTWALACRYDPNTRALRVLDVTTPTPALPYITALSRDADALADAIGRAITALLPEDRSALHIKGMVRIPAEDYLAVPTPPTT